MLDVFVFQIDETVGVALVGSAGLVRAVWRGSKGRGGVEGVAGGACAALHDHFPWGRRRPRLRLLHDEHERERERE